MSDEIKVGRLARDCAAVEIAVRKADAEPVRLTFPASSETPVPRWFGMEKLKHDSESIDTTRVNGGSAPLLFNHDWNDPIGMIDGARIEGGRLVVDAHLFATARAQEVAAMVEGGLRNVSIGYEINEMVEDRKTETYTATRWTPLEVSIVTVPADPSVGVGRQADDSAKPVRVVRTPDSQPAAAAATTKEQTMSVETTAAGASPDNTRNLSAQQIEAERQRAISNICEANNLAEPIKRSWIESGKDIATVSQELLDVLKSRNATPKSEVGLTPKEAQRYSIVKAIRAMVDRDWKGAGFERECHEAILKRSGIGDAPNGGFFVPYEVQKRDLTAASPSGGGYLVATDNLGGSFIDLLRNRTLVAQLGATMLTGLQGNVTIPRQTGANTAYWLTSESNPITEGNASFGQVSLTPKHVGAYQEISRQLMMQSSPAVDQLVMNDLARVVGIAIDLAAFEGSGNSGQPTGISATSGIGSVTGTSIDYAKVLEFQTDVAGANALAANCAYVTTPTVAGLLLQRARFSNTDTPLWEGSVLDGRVAGFRAASTLQLTAGSMIFGDFSQVVIGEWGQLEIALNPYASFTAAITGIRAIQTVDVGIRQAGAFSRATSIT